MLIDDAGALLTKVVTHAPDFFREMKSESLIEAGRPARVDFVTLVEDGLSTLPYIGSVTQSALSLMSAYYLAAANLVIPIPGVDVVRTLDKLNTNRDPVESALGGASTVFKFVGTENFELGLPSPELGIEAYGDAMTKNYEKGSTDKSVSKIYGDGASDISHNETITNHTTNFNMTGGGSSRTQPSGSGMGKDTVTSIKDLANMSVGKQFELVFERDGNRKGVLVNIRLACTSTDAESYKTILATGSPLRTFGERLRRAKAGELEYFKDLLLCNDLMEEAMKTRINDRSGFYAHMMRKRSKNWLSGLLSLNPGVNNASAVLIFSSDTAKRAELELGGSLDDFKIRQRVFKSVAAALMIVVDREWEVVTFYHRSLDTYNTVAVRDLERAAKKGDNIEDMLRAYSKFVPPMN